MVSPRPVEPRYLMRREKWCNGKNTSFPSSPSSSISLKTTLVLPPWWITELIIIPVWVPVVSQGETTNGDSSHYHPRRHITQQICIKEAPKTKRRPPQWKWSHEDWNFSVIQVRWDVNDSSHLVAKSSCAVFHANFGDEVDRSAESKNRQLKPRGVLWPPIFWSKANCIEFTVWQIWHKYSII